MNARALLVATLVAAACSKSDVCEGEACDEAPDTPWDPGDPTDTGGAYGDDPYGTDPTDTEPTETREILTIRDCNATARVFGSHDSVEIAGEFNGWVPQAMTGPDEDGYWEASLGELGPGEYAFKYIFDGVWEEAPPINVYTKWIDGSENRNLRVGDCMAPLLQTVTAAGNPDGSVQATVQVAAAADGAAIDPATVRVTLGGVEVAASIDTEAGTITLDATGLAEGKQSLRVWAADTSGRRAENEPLFVPLWVEDTPFTWEDATIYFAFVDRFRNGDWDDEATGPIPGVAECANYQGGDFLGVIHAMEEDYFVELGANTLWLSPAYDNPEGGYIGMDGFNMFSGYHGYWPIDPLSIENRFGDRDMSGDDRLAELIDMAHAKGIRVLFDLVLNHVHEDHTYTYEHPEWFGDGCICGTEGCGWDEKPVECWFMDYLPDLDYKNHDIVEQVVDDTLRLIELYDVDAVRVDAAKHMDHVIMRTLSMRLRDDLEAGGGAEVYMVGETFTSDRGLIMDYVNEWELDGQFDFPLYYTVRDVFVGDHSFEDLEASVATSEATYGDGLMSPFLGNHDIDRFASAVTGEAGDCWSGWLEDPMAEGGGAITEWDVINRASMGFAFVLTQPGAPLIYYGDEIGLHGIGDPDNRRLMNFDPYLSANQNELRDRVRVLGKVRQDHVALRRGSRAQLWVDDDLYVYARDAGGGDMVIVAMNKGWSTRTETVSMAGLGIEGTTLTDVVGSVTATVGGDGSATISLGSWQYAILVP